MRQALLSAVPPPRKKPAPRVLDPAKAWIDAMLREDVTAPRKQKHTARRIHQRLAQEYGFDQVSYSTVCDYVLARRPQIEAEVVAAGKALGDHAKLVRDAEAKVAKYQQTLKLHDELIRDAREAIEDRLAGRASRVGGEGCSRCRCRQVEVPQGSG